MRAIKVPPPSFKFKSSDPFPSFPPSSAPSSTLAQALREAVSSISYNESTRSHNVRGVVEHYQSMETGGGGIEFTSLVGPLSAIEILAAYWTDLALVESTQADSWTALLSDPDTTLPTLPNSLQTVASQISERALQTWEETVSRVEAAVERRNEAEVLDDEQDEIDSLHDETLGAGTVLDACLVSHLAIPRRRPR
jgi:hypothetical protein